MTVTAVPYFSQEPLIELDVPPSVEQLLQLDDAGVLAEYQATVRPGPKRVLRLSLPPAKARKLVYDAEYFGAYGTGVPTQTANAAYRWARGQRGEMITPASLK